jgi:hypothetical protein
MKSEVAVIELTAETDRRNRSGLESGRKWRRRTKEKADHCEDFMDRRFSFNDRVFRDSDRFCFCASVDERFDSFSEIRR